ncbi:hypothetical protein ACHAW5_011178 [Stephanodiscus triporus]|uniref:Uncharacterized protein n=1 Tax=Stephanodiscus triporus TaxID=2934178 RepID=A0ABD3PSQ9_9STRA
MSEVSMFAPLFRSPHKPQKEKKNSKQKTPRNFPTEKMNNNFNCNEKPYDNEDCSDFIDRRASLSDASHGSDSFSTDQPKKKAKVEDFSPIPNAEGFARMAGDPNLIALGSMAMPNFHPNFSLAFGGGLVQPMQQMNFLGASPGFHAVGQPHNGQYLYGYGPGFAAMHHATANGGEAGTPGYRSNDDGSADGEGCHRRPRPMSGMTPLVFAGMPTSFQAARGPIGYEGNFHPVMQVVSTDSQADDGNGTTTRVRMVPMGNVVVPLQQPKKWVRWSEHEDQILARAVEQYGENSFRHISEQIFHGSRTEVQCKNRWKKALQPGLVKGRWTKEEDDIITECISSGNDKWSEIAKRLPGRIGEQIKERWINALDPNVKKGIWTDAEMKLLRDSQRELGNKWSEIAKRIPGRNENSVKNRWYNQKTSDKRAQKKKREETPGRSESERDATPQNHMAGPMMDYEDDSDEEGEEEDSNIFGQPYKV